MKIYYAMLTLVIALAAFPLLSPASPAEESSRPFSFVQMCDTQLGMGGYEHDFEGIKLVTGETTSKNFDGRPMGFRWWDVDEDGALSHRFVRIEDE